jgi:hypothetical protein
MRRRQFLVSTALLATVSLPGCSLRDHSLPSPSAPDAVTDWTFERRDPAGPDKADAEPAIACSRKDNRVRITGTMWSGNPCKELGVKSIERDGEVFRFEVSVYKVQGGSCPDSSELAGYEATFTFDSLFPSVIVATETLPGDWGPDTRQRKKC